jgi:non-ribosomal peptide synthetase-like protein
MSLFGLFVLSIFTGLLFVAVMPRIANLVIKQDRTYVLYGLHYIVFAILRGISNSRFYNDLFGDSSYIVYYLKLIGYDLGTVIQTGSNFGTMQKHDNPLLCRIGTGTMVSDGLTMMNAKMSTTSFKLSQATIGDHNYLGNMIHYPAEGRTGRNCLLATKVMIPIDGPVREDVGLLGSPAFEIPRTTLSDQEMKAVDEDQRARDIRRKNRHNIRTMALFLGSKWLFGVLTLLLGLTATMFYHDHGILALLGGGVAGFAMMLGYFVLQEWLSLGFKRLEPVMCTIYDQRFWGVERHWKVADTPLRHLFAGTPFKNVISRMLGARIGNRVFDDGCIITEKTLIEVGDDCTLNEASILQSHSMEEGVFKADFIRLGNGCTLGINAFAHYGVTMGDNAILAADSFLMKGETVESDEVWMGNPAKAI